MPRPINVGASGSNAGGGDASFTITANSSASYALIHFGAQNASANAFSSSSYGGQLLTPIGQTGSSNLFAVGGLLGFVNPTTGSNTLITSASSGILRHKGWTFLANVDVTNPTGSVVSTYAQNITTASITIPSNDNAVCYMSLFAAPGVTFTPGPDEWVVIPPGGWSSVVIAKNGEANTTFATTISAVASVAIIAVSINGTANPPSFRTTNGTKPFSITNSPATGKRIVITN